MTTTQIGKILVVDDEVELKNILVESLTSQGYETSGLTSSEKALASLRTEPFDVVLTDMMMAGMDGITLVQEGLQIDPHLVCIVMTGQGTIQTAVDSMKVGAFDYILKPLRLQTLLPLITRAMNVRHKRLESASLYTQVRRAEHNYRSIFENAVEGIFQSTPDRRVITANPSMARILGYDSPQELIASFNDNGAELYVDPAAAEEVTRTLEAEGIVKGYEFEAYCKDGEKIWLSLNIRLIRDDHGTALFREGAIEDITEHKRAETERQRLEEQLRHSQKMEAIGQLAAGVAHDFNNLLTAINGYSSLALQRGNPDSRTKTYLEEIRKAGDRAANLTRQLLAFGRKQMLKPVALNLNEVVFDMNKMLRRLIGEDIKFDAKLDPQLKKIKADPGLIEQVLVNLVVNGRDAMPQGGALTIETTNFELDQEYTSKLLALPPGGYVMLAVSDTGCGMDMETKGRIFEPFFTTKDKGRGTGLGLSTVYGIVKQSGGNIRVYSEPNRGTTVKVYLPHFDGDEEPAERPSVETAAPRGSETILLVEDENVVRGLARQILEQAGYNVLDAGNGEEALRLCRQHSDPIHLLLTDVVMPETSGKEIAHLLTSLQPATRVLFMSGYTDDAIVHHGVLDTSVEFIQKPFTPVGLTRKVRQVLDLNCGEQCKKLSRGGLQDDRK